MREPDTWWGHIPVVIEALWKVRDHEDWYRRQLRAVLTQAGPIPKESLASIPATGFYIRVVAGVAKDELICAFLLVENLDAYTSDQAMELAILQRTVHHPLSELGTDANPFAELFDGADVKVAARWEHYLRWRRRKRWKPVPEWLVELRAAGRPKRRLRKTTLARKNTK